MDTRQLAAFCAVVEKRSFSQAAEKLGVTQPAVSLQVRALEQRVVGALRRHRSLEFEPLVRDEIVLAVPPGHRAAGGELSLADLGQETLVVMQEGAGVRQVIEEELRRAGLRLRALAPQLELGLQESVKTAVAAGYGVAFISRTAIEGELAAGTLAAARVAGLEPSRQL